MFIQSFVLMAGGFVAPIIRKITPRAALLGTLAGVSITFISMRPALEMFMTPVIGLICFADHPGRAGSAACATQGHPGGPGRDRGRHAPSPGARPLLGFNFGGMSLRRSDGVRVQLRLLLSRCRRSATCSRGFQFLGVILVTAIPFGIYDLVEAMDNVESAAAAGDSFPTTRVLTADGVVSLIGCLMGNPFINAVYIGHPGWKAMGGRIGYSAAHRRHGDPARRWFGIISLMLALIPVVAISADPALHRHADRLAGVPGNARSATRRPSCWRSCRTGGVGQAADRQRPGRRRHQRRRRRLRQARQTGVLYHGLAILGGGAILAGLVLGAITVFIIDRDF